MDADEVSSLAQEAEERRSAATAQSAPPTNSNINGGADDDDDEYEDDEDEDDVRAQNEDLPVPTRSSCTRLLCRFVKFPYVCIAFRISIALSSRPLRASRSSST
jgi:hypothetical protein